MKFFISHLSARVGESLANCLSTLSVTASTENNDISGSIRHKSAIGEMISIRRNNVSLKFL